MATDFGMSCLINHLRSRPVSTLITHLLLFFLLIKHHCVCVYFNCTLKLLFCVCSYTCVEQLQEIRKTRLARVVCDNTDLIDTIQLWPMVLPDHEMYVLLIYLIQFIIYNKHYLYFLTRCNLCSNKYLPEGRDLRMM